MPAMLDASEALGSFDEEDNLVAAACWKSSRTDAWFWDRSIYNHKKKTELTNDVMCNGQGALCFCCGALSKVPIQTYIFPTEVSLTGGKFLFPFKH